MLLGVNGLVLAGAGGGRQNCYVAKASTTAMAAYTATAAIGGPLLYNPSTSKVTAYVLAISYGVTTASTVASSIGVAVGLSTAPTSTGAIGLSGNLNPAGPAASCTVFSTGTVSVAATAFLVTGEVGTGALTVVDSDDNLVHLGGLIVVPPGYFACVASGATLTTSVIDSGLVWMEATND